MKLYRIFSIENGLSPYHSGIALVWAHSLEEAIEIAWDEFFRLGISTVKCNGYEESTTPTNAEVLMAKRT